jgi:TolA-binding protein
MSRTDAWMEMQCRTVQSGNVLAAWITLEGTDGTTWGTWEVTRDSSELEQLKRTVTEQLNLLGDELPTGRHQCKLVALDAARNQVALLPVVVTGRSSVAASAASEAKAMQQAVSIHVANTEAIMLGLQQENERLRTRNTDLEERIHDHEEAVLRLQQAGLEFQIDVKREEGRQRRMDDIYETGKPLLEVLMGIAAEELATIVEGYKERSRQKKEAKESAPGEVAKGGLALVDSKPKKAENDGPGPASAAQPNDASAVPPADKPKAVAGDGSGVRPTSNRSSSTGAGGGDRTRRRVVRRGNAKDATKTKKRNVKR